MTLQPTEYRPTATDRVWLLRAVEGEGAPADAVAAALVNRFIWLRAKRRLWRDKSLAQFVRAYSSPVNPRRMRGGDIWERLYREGTPAQRRKLEEAHERREAHSARNVFSQSTMDAVERALSQGPQLPTVTDFAAHWLEPSEGLRLVRAGSRGVNALYTADPSWDGYRVEDDGRAERDGGLMPLLAFVGFIALDVIWGNDA